VARRNDTLGKMPWYLKKGGKSKANLENVLLASVVLYFRVSDRICVSVVEMCPDLTQAYF